MKKSVVLLLVIFAGLTPGRLWAQPDSLKIHKENLVLLYVGLGGGINTRGGNFDLGLTLTSQDGLGGSLQFISGFVQLENIPDDYYEGFLRFATPAHDLTALTLNFVKKFITPKGSFRFGFEAGPSWIHCDQVKLELNPDYPEPLEYKYNKIHTIKYTIGVSLAMRADFPFSRFFGCDLSVFANLNSAQSFAGLDFCFDLGMVRK
jgi:hypothetical protein